MIYLFLFILGFLSGVGFVFTWLILTMPTQAKNIKDRMEHRDQAYNKLKQMRGNKK